MSSSKHPRREPLLSYRLNGHSAASNGQYAGVKEAAQHSRHLDCGTRPPRGSCLSPVLSKSLNILIIWRFFIIETWLILILLKNVHYRQDLRQNSLNCGHFNDVSLSYISLHWSAPSISPGSHSQHYHKFWNSNSQLHLRRGTACSS